VDLKLSVPEAVLGNTDINLFIIFFIIIYNIRAPKKASSTFAAIL